MDKTEQEESSASRKGQMQAYRQQLIESAQHGIDEFDKAVMTLSGGALGISFAFVENFVDPEDIVDGKLLFWAWMCWGVSILSVLYSHYSSHRAMRRAIDQLDGRISARSFWFDGLRVVIYFLNPFQVGKIRSSSIDKENEWEGLGGIANLITNFLNLAGGLLFGIGLLLLALFVDENLSHAKLKPKAATPTTQLPIVTNFTANPIRAIATNQAIK